MSLRESPQEADHRNDHADDDSRQHLWILEEDTGSLKPCPPGTTSATWPSPCPKQATRLTRGTPVAREGQLFVWERPLRPKEIEALGNRRPGRPDPGRASGAIGAKEALIADDPRVFFTTAHFDGYAAILVRLDRIAARGSRGGRDRGVARARAGAPDRGVSRRVVLTRGRKADILTKGQIIRPTRSRPCRIAV